MSQRQQLERIFEIDRSVRAGEYPNARKIAARLSASIRVIYNDRTFMIDRLGAPLQFNTDNGGWYYTNPAWMLPNIMVTEGELLAFFLSLEASRRFLGSELENLLRSTVDKIVRSMKGSLSVDLESLRAHYTFSQTGIGMHSERALLDMHDAIRRSLPVKVHYYTASRGVYTWRTLNPYHLHNLGGDWYLVAYDSYRKAFRSFAVSRILEWTVLERPFKPDPSFSVSDYLTGGFQIERGERTCPVAIRFDALQARYIRERHWHETQTIEELPDGGLVLRFSSSGLGEVQRWVMQYGAHAEVLEPEELRDNFKLEITNLINLYLRNKP